MNTRPLPPSCRRCGGEGSIDGDPWTTCPDCAGTGEAVAKPLRAGLVAVVCIAAAVVGSLIPSGWYLG